MEEGEGEELLARLPPLPAPDLGIQRREASGGVAMVLGITVMCVGATETGTSCMVGWISPEAIWTFRMLVYVEALVAAVCLLGLMLGDPGVIRRSRYTCLPIPEEVAAKLRSGEPVQPMENVVADGQVYCTRCLLWRHPSRPWGRSLPEACCDCPSRSNRRIHHCSTCQRCVEHFDHHCAVFGRCIAGRGFGGNMGYFKVIIGTSYVACFGSFGVLTVGLSHAGEVGYWLAVLFASYAAAMCCAMVCMFCYWTTRSLWIKYRLWEFWPLRRRADTWRGFKSMGGEGSGSDLDVPPVDAVIIGSRH